MAQFSQRYGYKRVDKLIQREAVSPELRIALWNVLNLYIWQRWERYSHGWTPDSERINKLSQRLWIQYFKADIDHQPCFAFADSRRGAYDFFKDYFMGSEWYEVFDFIEFLAKDTQSFISPEISKVINFTLESENSAYRLVGQEIVEITDKNQISAIQQALEVRIPSVRIHLDAALGMLSDRAAPDYRNSIKESISAVEAVCREISDQPTATLGVALKKIDGLHPCLNKAFSSLYGYTSDASGIRHALLDKPNLSKKDAVFMLVTCSAFVGFLQETAPK